jgi:hypothetical protein
MRLTFDDDVRAQAHGATTFSVDAGLPVIDGFSIVEMKFCIEPPAVLKEFVERFRLSPARISKYRLSLSALTTLPRNATRTGLQDCGINAGNMAALPEAAGA